MIESARRHPGHGGSEHGVRFLSATLRGGGATSPPSRGKGKKMRGRSGQDTGTRDRMMPYVQDYRERGSSVSGESSQWAVGADVSMASEGRNGVDEFKDGEGGQDARRTKGQVTRAGGGGAGGKDKRRTKGKVKWVTERFEERLAEGGQVPSEDVVSGEEVDSWDRLSDDDRREGRGAKDVHGEEEMSAEGDEQEGEEDSRMARVLEV